MSKAELIWHVMMCVWVRLGLLSNNLTAYAKWKLYMLYVKESSNVKSQGYWIQLECL